jgi:hypothetical protein
MNDQLLRTLTAADPARGVPVAPGDCDALLRRASHDVTNYDLGAPVRRRRVLLVAAAVAALTVTGTTAAVLLRAGPPADPGTPLVPAPSVAAGHCLDRIADRVAAGTAKASSDGATGRYEYLRTSFLSGSATQMQDGRFANLRYQAETSTWTADGRQRRRTVTQAPTFADEASRAFYTARPDMLPPVGTQTVDVPAGEFEHPDLPAADPAAMAAALHQPRENGPSQAVAGAAGLTRSRVLPAAHRAALLRFLAATDGVSCTGEQTDPAGRTGIAVSAPLGNGPQPSPGDHGAETVLVDPSTGEILAAGYTDATGTTWSSVFLERGYTDTRPAL